ncbi:MAG: glutamate-5-semialdehyde dehydrogenase [Deltaproteobacteria bacterium]|nr:glutamate-5-semialdehyde dehydrogenase [Deltaproteobacteria bacterium]
MTSSFCRHHRIRGFGLSVGEQALTGSEIEQEITRLAEGARVASRVVAKAPARVREQAIRGAAARVLASASAILDANRRDVEAARAHGLSPAMIDRLVLDEKRLRGLAGALEEVAGLPDPIGEIEEMRRRPNGLLVGKMRIPLGVIAIVYESRPNVTTDAFALCLRSGNAAILRGGSEAIHTNRALGEAACGALDDAGLPRAACQVVPMTDREAILALLRREEEIDLVIPRGGEGLIRFVSEHSRIPVIKHYKGVCHVFVDASADIDMAIDICDNAKVSRPGVCNACETILVHEGIAREFIPRVVAHLTAKGVEIRGDEATCALGGARVVPATPLDFGTEFLDLKVAMRVVPSLTVAMRHIEEHGSQHTEAIVTRDYGAAQRFLDEVGSSTVLVNASTRFADGGELGLGAEIGISTSKIHAFGPMGAKELTTTKFVVHGDGQVRK